MKRLVAIIFLGGLLGSLYSCGNDDEMSFDLNLEGTWTAKSFTQSKEEWSYE